MYSRRDISCREHIEDRIGRCHLGAVIQMGVDIERRGDVAVAKPLLNLLHADAICVEQAGTAMAKIMETYFSQAVLFENQRKMLRDITRRDEFSHVVDIDILAVGSVIGSSAVIVLIPVLSSSKSSSP